MDLVSSGVYESPVSRCNAGLIINGERADGCSVYSSDECKVVADSGPDSV